VKKLLILLALIWLTGCVSYYYPEPSVEDDGYYLGEAPTAMDYPDRFARFSYYPWSSLDYFYLGYSPFPRYGFGYGFDNGFPYGIGFGYSPWFYPHSYYGYYSPWYASTYHYPYYPARRPYYGDRARVNRRVSNAPPGYSSDRDLQIRSRNSAKLGRSRQEPVKSNPAGSVAVEPSSSPVAQPAQRSRRPGNGGRAVSSKRSKAIARPVGRQPAASNTRPASAPKPKTASGAGNRTVPIPSSPSKRELGDGISK
jgi:hypothetical protein